MAWPGDPMETERITLSQRERDRMRVLHEVKQGHLTQREAGSAIATVRPNQVRSAAVAHREVWRTKR